MYYLPIVLTIIANVVYHIAQRYTSEKINPFFSLMVTYTIALFVCIAMYFITKKNSSIVDEVRLINGATPILGFSIVLLELGFLLAYRYGWNVGTASIISTVLVTILLIPIGLFIFQENISLKNIAGVGLCIVGILFMNSK